MSALLLDQCVAYLRAAYTVAQVDTVDAYGGQFNVDEIGSVSFTCPAIFVSALGWEPTRDSKRLTGRHVRWEHMVAMVVTKAAKRTDRMRAAALLAESVALNLRLWVPDDTGQPWSLAALEEDPAAENLYGRKLDEKGLAMWLVRWRQAVQPVADPAALAALYDLVRVDITDTVRQGQVAQATPAAGTLVVTEDVQFGALG